MLRFIYRIYRQKLLNLMVADFFDDVPESIKQPSLEIMAQYRPKLDKLFLYQAYLLQRRIPANPRQADMLFGMLAELKILRQILDTTRSTNPYQDDGMKPASEAMREREEREKQEKDLDEALKGVDSFKRWNKE